MSSLASQSDLDMDADTNLDNNNSSNGNRQKARSKGKRKTKSEKLITCAKCNEVKKGHARGLCGTCYRTLLKKSKSELEKYPTIKSIKKKTAIVEESSEGDLNSNEVQKTSLIKSEIVANLEGNLEFNEMKDSNLVNTEVKNNLQETTNKETDSIVNKKIDLQAQMVVNLQESKNEAVNSQESTTDMAKLDSKQLQKVNLVNAWLDTNLQVDETEVPNFEQMIDFSQVQESYLSNIGNTVDLKSNLDSSDAKESMIIEKEVNLQGTTNEAKDPTLFVEPQEVSSTSNCLESSQYKAFDRARFNQYVENSGFFEKSQSAEEAIFDLNKDLPDIENDLLNSPGKIKRELVDFEEVKYRPVSGGLNQSMDEESKSLLKVCINCGELKCLIDQGRCDYCVRTSRKQIDKRRSSTLNKIANIFNISTEKKQKVTPVVSYLSFGFTGATVVNSGDGEENLSFSSLVSRRLEELNAVKPEAQYEFKKDTSRPRRNFAVRVCIECNEEKKHKAGGRCELCYSRWLSKIQNEKRALKKVKPETLDSFKTEETIGDVSMDESFLTQHTEEANTFDAFYETNKASNSLLDPKLASDEHMEKQNNNESRHNDDCEIYYNLDPYEMMP